MRRPLFRASAWFALTVLAAGCHTDATDEPAALAGAKDASSAPVFTGDNSAMKGAEWEPVTGQRWALLVGVNDYVRLDDLRFCRRDVEQLRDGLVRAGFPKRNVFMLSTGADSADRLPIRANIERQLKTVLALAAPSDLVLVCFSGHGMHLDGKSYLCPSEADEREPEGTLIALDDVYAQLAQSDAALRLFWVDACRNDPRPAGSKGKDGQSVRDIASELREPPRGVLVLASCAEGQISWEHEELRHGVFAYSLLKGLEGKADEQFGNRDDRVSLLELYRYANVETKRLVAGRWGEVQTPQLFGKIDGDFTISEAGKSTLVNVAAARHGAKATAISEGQYLGETQKALHAIDEDDTTAWASHWHMPAWLTVEFDKMYTLEKLRVRWGPNQHDFSISVSEDGRIWDVVVPERKAAQPPRFRDGEWVEGVGSTREAFPIDPVLAKYVRINITSTTAAETHIFQAIVHDIEAFARVED